MAIIDNRGFVDDGSHHLTIGGTCSTTANVMTAMSLATSGSVTIATSGLFTVAALVGFTGSLPAPSSWPGADIMFVETLGTNTIMLTGSMAMMASVGVNTVSSSLGTKLTLTKGGSVVLASDNARWLVCGVNGVATLAP